MSTNTAKPRVKAVTAKKLARRDGSFVAANALMTRAPSLADPAMASKLKAFKKEVTRTPEAANDFLRKIGLVTPSGRLSKTYGG